MMLSKLDYCRMCHRQSGVGWKISLDVLTKPESNRLDERQMNASTESNFAATRHRSEYENEVADE
jgi:hypothetical protein